MIAVSPARRARHRARTYVSEWPALYLPLARRRYPGPSPEVIGPDTELVIDGYTRCASTFAVYALQLAQHRPVRLAHHLHAPAQLIQAARSKIPALAVIREAEGAILSQLIREPQVAPRDALVAYARFYERLLPYRKEFVVADFEQVTKDFGAVIRDVNVRFGTDFTEFEPTEPNVRQCFELIKHRDSLSATLLGFESGVVTWDELRRELPALQRLNTRGRDTPGGPGAWVPSGERERAKAALREQWLRPDLAPLRQRAERVYRMFAHRDKEDKEESCPSLPRCRRTAGRWSACWPDPIAPPSWPGAPPDGRAGG
jgi:hypothetical protein